MWREARVRWCTCTSLIRLPSLKETIKRPQRPIYSQCKLSLLVLIKTIEKGRKLNVNLATKEQQLRTTIRRKMKGNHSHRQPPSHDVTHTPHDTDKQLMHQRTLGNTHRSTLCYINVYTWYGVNSSKYNASFRMQVPPSILTLSFPLPTEYGLSLVQGHLLPVKDNQIVTSSLMNHLDRRGLPLVCKCLQSLITSFLEILVYR